ncbi:hypothetical protein EV421DRAFT_1730897 [Armillaria borealis]|uniref:Uncharacterized protein n=1 Tax=Armillaria borealis TaxID=47425 RepID=A0AA39K3L7_9AGAR|nr:hypothetical protein EV421DRAFT_1730897 [Armillaria borealis]
MTGTYECPNRLLLPFNALTCFLWPLVNHVARSRATSAACACQLSISSLQYLFISSNSDQILWLTDQGPDFEVAVIKHRITSFLCIIYKAWFYMWPEEDQGTPASTATRIELRKIEIFKMYTMGLGRRWVCDGLIPDVYIGEEWQWELDDVEVMVGESWDLAFAHSIGVIRGGARMMASPPSNLPSNSAPPRSQIKMSESPYNHIFFLAADEEDAMKLFVADYWKSRRLGGQPLEDIRKHLWETWSAKFPIDFLALTGRFSTKEDEADCCRRKLRCIESYLIHLGSLTEGHGLDMLRRAIYILEVEEDNVWSLSADLSPVSSTIEVVPTKSTMTTPEPVITTAPRRSTRLMAIHNSSIPAGDSFSTPPQLTSKNYAGESSVSPTSTLFSPCKTPLRTYAGRKHLRPSPVNQKPSIGAHLQRPVYGSQTTLGYPVVKKKKIASMLPRRH